HLDLDSDAGRTSPGGGGIEHDHVTHIHGVLELDPVERHGNPFMRAVAPSLDETRLADVAQDNAAEDGAVLVGVFGHGHHTESRVTFKGWRRHTHRVGTRDMASSHTSFSRTHTQ